MRQTERKLACGGRRTTKLKNIKVNHILRLCTARNTFLSLDQQSLLKEAWEIKAPCFPQQQTHIQFINITIWTHFWLSWKWLIYVFPPGLNNMAKKQYYAIIWNKHISIYFIACNLPRLKAMHYCPSNVIMRSEWKWSCFVLARHCINIYFEQTQWQQAADAKRYLSSIIYVFFFFFPTLSICVSISPVHPPTHTYTHCALHKGVHKPTHRQWYTQWQHPQRNCMNAHTIAFSCWRKVAHWLHPAKWLLLSFCVCFQHTREHN